MRIRGLVPVVFAAFGVTFVALAAPPVPSLVEVVDGGWVSRRPDLVYSLPMSTPLDTMGADISIADDLGQDAGFFFVARFGTGQQDFTGPPLPDASYFTWSARGVDDAGAVSAWSAPGSFKVDDAPPPTPGAFTATLDAGVLTLTADPVVDLESGLNYYHFGVSRLDVLDGSVNFGGTMNLQPTAPTMTVFLGPGQYAAGVHAHDRVGNGSPSIFAEGLIVTASLSLPVPAPPEIIRFDGGTYTTFPYLPTDLVRFRVDAGSISPVVGFALSRRGRTETDWEMCDYGLGPTIVQQLPAGEQDVRVAVLGLDEVSEWSAPVRIFVDEGNPNIPNVSVSVDAGTVTLSWPSTRDNFGGSGVLEYSVRKLGLDASVDFSNVPHVPDASITFSDTPGFGAWTFAVAAIDRAGNVGTPAVRAVPLPPSTPRGLRAASRVTNQSIALTWDEDRDGGFRQTWTVTRLDVLDAGTVVAMALAAPAFTDDAPEGTWSYEVNAVVDALSSAPARLDAVVRDTTPPQVSTPALNRVGARTAEVSFTATDALSGVVSTRLERETNRGVVDLGEVTSPLTDTPSDDGTHRYRIIATDAAGNVTTSEWSAEFVTPGAGLLISPVEAQALTCGRPFEVALSASEQATWTLLSAPDGVSLDRESGILTWTPAAADVGNVVVRVKAQGATSFDQRDVTLDVSCTRMTLGLGCGCSAVDPLALLALAAVIGARRHRRK